MLLRVLIPAHPDCAGLTATKQLLLFTSDKREGICFHPNACDVCLSVCLCAGLLKNACMDLDEMLCVNRCRDMDKLINF